MKPHDSLQARVDREREAHSTRDVLAENGRIQRRFAHLDTYPSKVRHYELLYSFTQNLKGKTILDYGCARGEATLRFLRSGASWACGIDISPTYIEAARVGVAAAGFPKARYSFEVMDAHHLTFPDNHFDIVLGSGILHHLDPPVALAEIYRVLRPGGRCLLHEPLADNPLLKIFRFLTPHARTQDEAPFTRKQVTRLLSDHPWESHVSCCGLVELPVAMVTSFICPRNPANLALRLADSTEEWLNRKHILWGWNQCILFNLVKPLATSR